MLISYRPRAALAAAALLTLGACSDDAKLDGPSQDGADAQTVALVELEGARPAFYIQKPDGTGRTRIRFSGSIDEVSDNSPLVPALTDANILGLRSVKWSPDGTRIAFVATTAFDQAEVVVMKADGTDPRIVSPNYAYIAGDVDWSPDGTRVAYILATQPGLRGLEVFVSEVSGGAPRVTKVTTNSGYRGLGGTIRFASNGTAVWISQVTGEQGGPLFESIGAVRRVDLAIGAITPVLENIAGEVQAVSHTGGWALVIRHKSLTNGVYENQVVRIPLVGTGPEQLLVDGPARPCTPNDGRRAPLAHAGRYVVQHSRRVRSEFPGIRGSGAEQLSADVRVQ
jgi:hypothetical protein